MSAQERCPHCGFEGTPREVDEHRATGVHNDEEQRGGNTRQRDSLPAQARGKARRDMEWTGVQLGERRDD